MEKSLEALIHTYIDINSTQKDINNLIIHLIHEIPIPSLNKKLNFFLPYNPRNIELFSFIYKDLPYVSFAVEKIFDFLSMENISLIIFLILFEQKILFVCDDYNVLSHILLGFVSLLYPLEWTNILIPILSEELIKYLQCFRPFIMGIDENMIDIAKSYIEDETIFFVNIKKNCVETFSKKKLKKTTRKNLSEKNSGIPLLHEELVDEFKKELKIVKNLYEKLKKNKKFSEENNYLENIKKKIKKTFIKLMAFIFGDYKKYVSFIDKTPIFNTKSFIALKPEKYSEFYDTIVNTHIFKYFLQIESEENLFYFNKLCLRYSNRQYISFKNSKKKILIEKIHKNNSDKNNTGNNIINNLNNSFCGKSENFRSASQNTRKDIKFTDKKICNKTSNISSRKYSNAENSDSYSYSYSKSDNVEVSYNKNSENSENYIILPYFIHTLLNSEISKIEFFINEKNKSKKIL